VKFLLIGVGEVGSDALQRHIKPNDVGIMAEPVPHLYEAAKARWASHIGINVEYAAVCNEEHISNGSALFRYIPPNKLKGLPAWCRGLGSLTDRNALSPGYWQTARGNLCATRAGFDYARLSGIIEEIVVPAITPLELCDKYDLHAFDVVQIDAEGYDYEIIKACDFDRIEVGKLRYEYSSLTADEVHECDALLKAQGFNIRVEDTQNRLAHRA